MASVAQPVHLARPGIGKGRKLEDIVGEMRMVPEGIHTCRLVLEIASVTASRRRSRGNRPRRARRGDPSGSLPGPRPAPSGSGIPVTVTPRAGRRGLVLRIRDIRGCLPSRGAGIVEACGCIPTHGSLPVKLLPTIRDDFEDRRPGSRPQMAPVPLADGEPSTSVPRCAVSRRFRAGGRCSSWGTTRAAT